MCTNARARALTHARTRRPAPESARPLSSVDKPRTPSNAASDTPSPCAHSCLPSAHPLLWQPGAAHPALPPAAGHRPDDGPRPRQAHRHRHRQGPGALSSVLVSSIARRAVCPVLPPERAESRLRRIVCARRRLGAQWTSARCRRRGGAAVLRALSAREPRRRTSRRHVVACVVLCATRLPVSR